MVDRGRFNDMSDLHYLDDRIRSQAPLRKKTPLPKGFQPNEWSVLCGRGKNSFNHGKLIQVASMRPTVRYTSCTDVDKLSLDPKVGNRRFRDRCKENVMIYRETKSKIEKSLIVMCIVDATRESSDGGGFVRMVSGNMLTSVTPPIHRYFTNR
jgi:hypothetical protein